LTVIPVRPLDLGALIGVFVFGSFSAALATALP
jgi:hypothetical protein